MTLAGSLAGSVSGSLAGSVAQLPVPGLQFHHDASVASSITLSGSDISQWNDLSGNGYHMTVLGGSNAPAYAAGAVTFDAANTEGLEAASSSVDGMIGSKPFVFAIRWSGSTPRFGALNSTPRLYLEENFSAYNAINVIWNANAGTVRVWGHDGTNFFHRQDGALVSSSAAQALSSLSTSSWRTRGGIDGTLYRQMLYDASDWGGNFAAYLAAVETDMGV